MSIILDFQYLHLGTASPHHEVDTEDDERNAEQLSHVEQHIHFKSLLHFLSVLNEETEGEDIGETETEVEARPYPIAPTAVNSQSDEEQNGIGNCLVKLSWMARRTVDALEDKRPRHIGDLTYYLRIHEVAKTDETCRDGRCNGNVVEHGEHLHTGLPAIQP